MRNPAGWRRGAAALLGALVLLVALPATAYAHVRVDDGSSPGRGGYGLVRLVVPTESDTASTTGLTVTVPDDVTLASARVLPLPGWTASVETTGERVTRIVWRAEDPAAAGLGPAQFGIFTFSAGPWPDRDTVALPTTQQYSDGTTVAWDEVALDADSEPEHPAPLVTLAAAAADHHGAAQAAGPAPGGGDTAPPVAGGGHEAGGAGGTEIVQWVLIGLAVVLSAFAAVRTWSGRTGRPTVRGT